MMRFAKVPEPKEFDSRVRKRGLAWLAEHPREHPHRYSIWREFNPQLREGFRGLCAYSAMWVQRGEIDHFTSCDERRELAYEWDNYRYADGTINSSKQHRDVAGLLDPYEVQDDWFEILLPSLQLVVTDRCPPELRERARTMLDKPGLGHSDWILDVRRGWYEEWEHGMKLERLELRAPLIARAIRKREAAKARTNG